MIMNHRWWRAINKVNSMLNVREFPGKNSFRNLRGCFLLKLLHFTHMSFIVIHSYQKISQGNVIKLMFALIRYLIQNYITFKLKNWDEECTKVSVWSCKYFACFKPLESPRKLFLTSQLAGIKQHFKLLQTTRLINNNYRPNISYMKWLLCSSCAKKKKIKKSYKKNDHDDRWMMCVYNERSTKWYIRIFYKNM